MERGAVIRAGLLHQPSLNQTFPAGESLRFPQAQDALTYVVQGVCVLRYDDEAGKGDHRHLGDPEEPYRFTTPAALLRDFWADVDAWRLKP